MTEHILSMLGLALKAGRVEVGEEQAVAVRPANGAKCLRCWKVLPTVGSDAGHPDLCPRCAAVVKNLPVIE